VSHSTIGRTFATFRSTKNPLLLLKAVALIATQGRIDEVLHGLYCKIFHRPSPVYPLEDKDLRDGIIEATKRAYCARQFLVPRDQLIEDYGKSFAVHALPQDLAGCSSEGIVIIDDLLVLGEYGNGDTSAKIALVKQDNCHIVEFYNRLPGVLHIHAIHKYSDTEILVSTGDTKKLLDLWRIDGNEISFKTRLKKRLAGYTGCAEVAQRHFFGTDFAGRPNYIATLEGEKYFFPEKAFRMYVLAFYPFFNRYIASVSGGLYSLGGRKTLSIFDTVNRKFTYCEYMICKNTDVEQTEEIPATHVEAH